MKKLSPRQISAIRADQTKREVYGGRPISLAGPVPSKGIFSKDKRSHVVSRVMEVMRDWRETPFESEGPVRAGLRSALCLDGHGWGRSDHEAEIIVGVALMNLGAARPTWEQGQREYTTPRENCAWCGGGVPEDLTVGNRATRFCSGVCARSALQHREFKLRKTSDDAYAAAIYTIRRAAFPAQACLQCSKQFRPIREGLQFCSHECSAAHNRYLPLRHCRGCQREFRPRHAEMFSCSAECSAKSRRKLAGKACGHCGATFRPRGRNTLFCSRVCTDADKRSRRVGATCSCCGDSFEAETARAIYCSKACENLVWRVRQGQQKSLTPQVFDILFHAPATAAEPIAPALTAEIFDQVWCLAA